MTARQYRAPPIIDAIIEVRFGSLLTEAERQRVSTKFEKRYPFVQEVVNQRIAVTVGAAGSNLDTIDEEHIFRRTSAEMPEVLQVGSKIFSVASQAPYQGWDYLFDRLVSDWAIARKVWGYRPIERVGLRFINRLDLKPDASGVVEYERYLNLRINLPESFPHIYGYSLDFMTAVDEIGCDVRVQSGVTDPGMPGGTSFLLDIDVWRQREVPQKDVEVLELLGEMRVAKNGLFETFITDEARALFNAG
ncbi:MAG: TIGR04255 family protein [Allosphingosinicella sp.]